MGGDTLTHTFAKTARMDTGDIVHALLSGLGPTLVAVIAGVRDRKLPYRWARKEVTPRTASEKRLREAHRVWVALEQGENAHIARAWFIGLNPRLGEEEPAIALSNDRFAEVHEAARAFLDDSDYE